MCFKGGFVYKERKGKRRGQLWRNKLTAGEREED